MIVKQLSAVETLGSTTHIATGRTGTLTLNEMTVRRLLLDGCALRVTGEGYSTEGRILGPGDAPARASTEIYLAMALCSNTTVRDGQTIGDPTEGALVVLAGKGGVDVERARREHPRVAEVPSDSEYKFHATLHAPASATGDTAAAACRTAGRARAPCPTTERSCGTS